MPHRYSLTAFCTVCYSVQYFSKKKEKENQFIANNKNLENQATIFDEIAKIFKAFLLTYLYFLVQKFGKI